MLGEQLRCLEEYLRAKKMDGTLHALRKDLMARVPPRPTQQLLSLLARGERKENVMAQPSAVPKKNEPNMKKRKGDKTMQSLLNRLINSSKLLNDDKANEQVGQLLQNKIFKNAVKKMFPEKADNEQHSYYDELDMMSLPCNEGSKNNGSQKEGQSNCQIVSQGSEVELQQEGSKHHIDSLLDSLKLHDDFDEYLDDHDMGYHEYLFQENELMTACVELTLKLGYPSNAVKPGNKIPEVEPLRMKFSASTVFPPSEDLFYPVESQNIIYDCMRIKVIYDREKTGYEEEKQLRLHEGDIIAGRFVIEEMLGSGVFARVLKVREKNTGQLTCFKVVANNKDFLDQAMDEIKLLKLIGANCDPSQQHLLGYKNVFYHREHLFIETQLLKENLFVAYRKTPALFSLSVIRAIARQVLTALSTLHSLKIIHSDLKPENILIKSYSPVSVVVIDLGNSCFLHDNLGTYVQSRSYRAPQVVLGNNYNEKIDIWSLGCILAELWTKNVLFYNQHIQGMLARIQSIVGPWPAWMLDTGKQVSTYFSKENLIFFEENNNYHVLVPKKTTLRNRIRTDDGLFLSFLSSLLTIDPHQRCSAQEALAHPFLKL